LVVKVIRMMYDVQASLFGDDVTDMLLAAAVQRVEEHLELVGRLATENCEQLLVGPERRHLSADVVPLRGTDDVVGVQLADKTRELDVECLQQKHVVRSYEARVHRPVLVVCYTVVCAIYN